MSSNPNFSKDELIEEIKRLKEKHNAVILAHNYTLGEIQDIADFCGDSLELSIKAANVTADVIVFCGVRFMAETAKVLSPEKTVLLPTPNAGCAMANMVTAAQVREMRKAHPNAKVVCYVNSTADVKAEVDVCCTSANAEAVVSAIPEEHEIIFIPDGNLARNVANKLSRKVIPYKGYCPIHHRFTTELIESRRREFPNAKVFVHPECPPEVVAVADESLSTGGMLKYVRESAEKMFIVGTEIGIIYRLRKENPDKVFIPLTEQAVCPEMKLCELYDVYLALLNQTENIELPEEIISKGRLPIDRMLTT